MSSPLRPWWLWLNKPGQFLSTVQDESTPEERIFVIRGLPVINNLSWLVWGPVAALMAVVAITGLAIAFDARSQPALIKAMYVLAFLALPAFTWGLAIVLTNRVAKNVIQAEQESGAKGCTIRLDPDRQTLYYRPKNSNQETTVPYRQIKSIKVTTPIGGGNTSAVCLAMETERGKVILLDEHLGTESQKYDLAREIQTALGQLV